MSEEKTEAYKAIIHLVNGEQIETQISGPEYGTEDFKETTIWRFLSRDHKKNYFFTGDKINYIELIVK